MLDVMTQLRRSNVVVSQAFTLPSLPLVELITRAIWRTVSIWIASKISALL